MKNKKVIIGVGLLALGALGYLVLKNKTKKQEKQIIDEEGEADFDFENATGKKTGLQNIINRPKKIIKVKDYQALIRNGSLNELNKYLVGKNIYTLQNNVNLRTYPQVNNGLMNNNIELTLKNKGVFVGRVEEVVRGIDGKNIWFSISNKGYNPSFSERMFYAPGPFGIPDYDVREYIYVRADVVVVDLY